MRALFFSFASFVLISVLTTSTLLQAVTIKTIINKKNSCVDIEIKTKTELLYKTLQANESLDISKKLEKNLAISLQKVTEAREYIIMSHKSKSVAFIFHHCGSQERYITVIMEQHFNPEPQPMKFATLCTENDAFNITITDDLDINLLYEKAK